MYSILPIFVGGISSVVFSSSTVPSRTLEFVGLASLFVELLVGVNFPLSRLSIQGIRELMPTLYPIIRVNKDFS